MSAATGPADTFVDAYALLGLPRDALHGAIKTAYRERAREVHPDKNPSPQAAALFHAIKAASEALLDGAARAALDRQLDARAAEAARVGAMDEVRRRLRSELEAREREAAAAAGGRGGGGGGGGGASGGMSELERLRRQGADLRSAYAERLDLERSAAAAALAAAAAAGGGGGAAPELDLSMAVRVRWGEELAAEEAGGAAPGQQLSDAHLARAFALAGEVTHVLSRKRCSAVLLFATANGAAAALVAPPAGMTASRVAGDDGGGGGGGGGAGALKRRRGDSEEGSQAQQHQRSAAAAAQEVPFLEREADVLGRVRALLGSVVGS